MSEKPGCFQDPKVFEADHPDCMGCDFYSPCKVLSKRNAKNARSTKGVTKSKGKSKSSGGRVVSFEVPVVEAPHMNFKDKLIWNAIREAGDAVLGEGHRAWNESIPRVAYTNILAHLEPKTKTKVKDAVENSEEDNE